MYKSTKVEVICSITIQTLKILFETVECSKPSDNTTVLIIKAQALKKKVLCLSNRNILISFFILFCIIL